MANSFLEFLESMSIAIEADDITSQTANEVRSEREVLENITKWYGFED